VAVEVSRMHRRSAPRQLQDAAPLRVLRQLASSPGSHDSRYTNTLVAFAEHTVLCNLSGARQPRNTGAVICLIPLTATITSGCLKSAISTLERCVCHVQEMSGRLISSAAPLARRVLPVTFRRLTHQSRLRAGGLLQAPSCLHSSRRRLWPMGSSFIHNVPATRAISFARIIPSLFMKLLRIPAMFGGAMIAGLVYLQYQATR